MLHDFHVHADFFLPQIHADPFLQIHQQRESPSQPQDGQVQPLPTQIAANDGGTQPEQTFKTTDWVAAGDTTGEFKRGVSQFRDWIKKGGEFPPERDRYHLYVRARVHAAGSFPLTHGLGRGPRRSPTPVPGPTAR